MHLTIYVAFSYTSCNQLVILPSKVKDDYCFIVQKDSSLLSFFRVLLYDKAFLFTRIFLQISTIYHKNLFPISCKLCIRIISNPFVCSNGVSYMVRIVFHFPLQYRSTKKITRTIQSITIATQTPNTPISKYFPKI